MEQIKDGHSRNSNRQETTQWSTVRLQRNTNHFSQKMSGMINETKQWEKQTDSKEKQQLLIIDIPCDFDKRLPP